MCTPDMPKSMKIILLIICMHTVNTYTSMVLANPVYFMVALHSWVLINATGSSSLHLHSDMHELPIRSCKHAPHSCKPSCDAHQHSTCMFMRVMQLMQHHLKRPGQNTWTQTLLRV